MAYAIPVNLRSLWPTQRPTDICVRHLTASHRHSVDVGKGKAWIIGTVTRDTTLRGYFYSFGLSVTEPIESAISFEPYRISIILIPPLPLHLYSNELPVQWNYLYTAKPLIDNVNPLARKYPQNEFLKFLATGQDRDRPPKPPHFVWLIAQQLFWPTGDHRELLPATGRGNFPNPFSFIFPVIESVA